MSTNKGLTGEWINVFMCTSLHQGTSVLQEYRVIPLVHHIRKSFEQVWTYMKWTHLNKFWTSLNTFQHSWTSFKQVWSHLNTFEQVLNKFEHKWTHRDGIPLHGEIGWKQFGNVGYFFPMKLTPLSRISWCPCQYIGDKTALQKCF